MYTITCVITNVCVQVSLRDGKQACRFDDNAHRQFSHKELEKFSKTSSCSVVAFGDNEDNNMRKKEKDMQMASINDSDDESINKPQNMTSGKLLKDVTRA